MIFACIFVHDERNLLSFSMSTSSALFVEMAALSPFYVFEIFVKVQLFQCTWVRCWALASSVSPRVDFCNNHVLLINTAAVARAELGQ